jgi:hypothetical protein
MPNFLANLSARVIGIAVAVLALILIVGFRHPRSSAGRTASKSTPRLARTIG